GSRRITLSEKCWAKTPLPSVTWYKSDAPGFLASPAQSHQPSPLYEQYRHLFHLSPGPGDRQYPAFSAADHHSSMVIVHWKVGRKRHAVVPYIDASQSIVCAAVPEIHAEEFADRAEYLPGR